ncbi:MAG: hypothetical protein LJE70_20595 [Chromatiaceae bacterium]|jgi:hypothetical protein|nr:hypothetical protein [Chromatiaceae bacterium]
MSETSDEGLRDRFTRLVEDEVHTLGLSLSTPCRGMLERMVADGAQRMEHDKVVRSRDKVQLAADNICLFVNRLAVQAKAREGFPVADEGAFVKAQLEGCPLWPFC